jgi:type I restriction enzyme, S subunit
VSVATTERLKNVAEVRVSNVDKKSIEGEEPVGLCNYTDVYHRGCIDHTVDFMEATATPEQIRTFALREGDTLMTKDSETAEDIGVGSFVTVSMPRVLCGYHLAVIRPHPRKVDPKYLYWSLCADRARGHLISGATGVTRFGLRSDVISGTPVSVPSVVEQRRIADFLDAETAALIAKRRQMIELLNERWLTTLETVMVTSATRETALKRVAVLVAGGTPSTDDPDGWEDGGVPWVTIGDMSGTRLVRSTKKAISAHGLRSARLGVGEPGAVLFAMYASVGAVSRLGVPACWNQAILGINGQPTLALNDFLELWLERLRPRLSELFRSNTQNNLNADQVGSLPFPVLPITEQRTIAEGLRAARDRRDHLTQTLLRQIELLNERRRALITAAVTGRLPIPA